MTLPSLAEKETKFLRTKAQERWRRTDNNDTKQVKLALPLDRSNESKPQRETSRGAKRDFWLRRRNSQKASRLKQQVWRHADPQWRAKSLADRSESRETVASVFVHRHDVSCIRSAACNRLWNIIANGVMFLATSQGVQKITITLTSLQHTLVYKRIQHDESNVRRWWKYSRTPQRSLARAPREAEVEEEKDKMRKMSWTFSTHWRVFTWKNS